ncbi:MAG: DHH family phosphoesterase, partial [Cytophagales bacterium]|nr:DHH family phosphoesterase [Cytophagales bacterium]
MIDKRWVVKPTPADDRVNRLSNAINVSKPIARILCQRGIDSYDRAKEFFNPSLDQLIDPLLMKDMDKAVSRIDEAIREEENILVYGDYDVDGTTSVALFFGFLNSFYEHCDFYIPDRYKEGYGISKQGIDWALQQGFSLIIALDCGIKSVDLIGYARDKGIDFIVCDHHLPGDVLPPAVAILDPKRKDCSYPFKELPGCGIGFKLAQAITQRIPTINADPLGLLDLVAVSIASDIVPIYGENRVLTYFGVQRLENNPRPGLKALMRLAGILKRVTVTHIVFGLAPRINAAGRISHAKAAVNLLLAKSEEEAD